MLRGGGVAPSEIMGLGEPCKDSVAVTCFCPSCCEGPLVWRVFVARATMFAAVAIVAAETWMVFGAIVV